MESPAKVFPVGKVTIKEDIEGSTRNKNRWDWKSVEFFKAVDVVSKIIKFNNS